MIDGEILAQGMGMLGGAYGRIIDEGTTCTYRDALDPKMTTDEFMRAVRAAIETETYWPSPAVLLSKVSRKSEGAAAFLALVDQLRTAGGYRFFPHEKFAALPEPVRAAVKAIGGLAVITNAPDERAFHALEQRFSAAYVAAVTPQPRLAAPAMDPTASRLVRETARAIGRDRQLPATERSA